MTPAPSPSKVLNTLRSIDGLEDEAHALSILIKKWDKLPRSTEYQIARVLDTIEDDIKELKYNLFQKGLILFDWRLRIK